MQKLSSGIFMLAKNNHACKKSAPQLNNWGNWQFFLMRDNFYKVTYPNFFTFLQDTPLEHSSTGHSDFFATFYIISDVRFDIDLILRLLLVELNMQNPVFKFYAGFFRQSMGVLWLKYLVLIMKKWFLIIKVHFGGTIPLRFDHLQKRSNLA